MNLTAKLGSDAPADGVRLCDLLFAHPEIGQVVKKLATKASADATAFQHGAILIRGPKILGAVDPDRSWQANLSVEEYSVSTAVFREEFSEFGEFVARRFTPWDLPAPLPSVSFWSFMEEVWNTAVRELVRLVRQGQVHVSGRLGSIEAPRQPIHAEWLLANAAHGDGFDFNRNALELVDGRYAFAVHLMSTAEPTPAIATLQIRQEAAAALRAAIAASPLQKTMTGDGFVAEWLARGLPKKGAQKIWDRVRAEIPEELSRKAWSQPGPLVS